MSNETDWPIFLETTDQGHESDKTMVAVFIYGYGDNSNDNEEQKLEKQKSKQNAVKTILISKQVFDYNCRARYLH